MKHIIITASLLFSSVALAAPIGPGNGSGAVQTVIACTSWTPTDQSGASLTFTSVSAQYCVYGNLVFAYGTLTYPTTASIANATISLPVPVPNQSYAAVPGPTVDLLGNGDYWLSNTNTNPGTATLVNAALGTARTNANVSTKKINFFIMYPAS